jgi:flagellar basal-body rod protein FlgC
MGGLLGTFQVSASGLAGMRRKMDATAANIANAETSRTPDGGPYRRQVTVSRAQNDPGSFAHKLARARLDLRRTHARHIAPKPTTPRTALSVPLTETTITRSTQVRHEYMPGHPDADADGFVAMPDIDILAEMVEMMLAARAYEANATALEAAKQMAQRALEL